MIGAIGISGLSEDDDEALAEKVNQLVALSAVACEAMEVRSNR